MSFGAVPTIVELDAPGTTLVLGEDLDNTTSGAGANGVGKTTVINALVYALYDKPISNISKDNLVNNINKKNMEVTLTFKKGDDEYFIKRVRKTKAGAAGNWVKLWLNGKDITPDSVDNTNHEIEKIMGIPFDLFVRIVAVSATHTPFLDLPVRHASQANQTDIIEELFDLKQLSEKALLLKDEIKITDRSIEVHQGRIDGLEREHERHRKQIKSAEMRVIAWQKSNEQELEKVKTKLAKIADINVDTEKAALASLDKITSQCNEHVAKSRTISKEIAALNKNIKTVKGELSHLDEGECPYCLQQYANSAAKKKELQRTIETDEQLVEQLTKQLIEEDTHSEQLSRKQEDLRSLITVSSVDELYDIRGKINGYEKQLKTLDNAINPMIEPLDELEEIELEPVDMSKINELKELLDHQKFLLKLLTKKDSFVRKALLTKNIPFLNQRLSGYLSDLGLPHTVEFTHEMTANISQFGRPLDFGNLSNGQRARVNLALSFAFRDVLQSIHGRINVCMLDEVLDVGLDVVGIQNAAKMLKQKSRDENVAMYIISHRDEVDNAFDRTMTIQLSKGFSYVGEII